MAILLALSLLLAGGDWEFRPGTGFLNRKTMEQKTPDEFLELGLKLHADKNDEEALEILALLVEAPVEAGPREKGLFLRARILAEGGKAFEGYQEFDRFTRLFPESEQTSKAREWLMACALELAKAGHKDFLFFKTSKTGIDLLRTTLQRFPRETFTDDYYLKFARFYIDRGDLDFAETELKTLLDSYRTTNSAPRALLMLADVGRRRFEGVAYDVKVLADCKRYYEQFLGDYPRLADDPAALQGFDLDGERLAAMVQECRDGIRFVTGRLAEKELELAKFYLRRDRPKSARLYLRTILKSYAGTPAAEEAQKLLDGIAGQE